MQDCRRSSIGTADGDPYDGNSVEMSSTNRSMSSGNSSNSSTPRACTDISTTGS